MHTGAQKGGAGWRGGGSSSGEGQVGRADNAGLWEQGSGAINHLAHRPPGAGLVKARGRSSGDKEHEAPVLPCLHRTRDVPRRRPQKTDGRRPPSPGAPGKFPSSAVASDKSSTLDERPQGWARALAPPGAHRLEHACFPEPPGSGNMTQDVRVRPGIWPPGRDRCTQAQRLHGQSTAESRQAWGAAGDPPCTVWAAVYKWF